jgi:hypothetical protein
MMILGAALAFSILAISYYLWPKDQKSLRLVIMTALIMSSIVALGILMARSLPVTRKETVEKVVQLKYVKPPQVITKEKVVYRIPGKEFDPLNVVEVCSGKMPSEIMALDVSANEDKTKNTWLIVRPLGRLIKVTCVISGDLDNFWKVGDVVQFKDGRPQ